MIEISTAQIIVMFFLCLLAGFIDSIAGGGGLISLTSYYAIGLPPIYALGNNKFSSTFGTFVAMVNYSRKRNVIWSVAIPAAILALIGSRLGAQIALVYAGRVFRYVLLVVLPILTVLTLRKKTSKKEEEILDLGRIPSRVYIVAMALGFALGAYDGFFGPGTGMFYTLGFTFVGLPMINACGTTKVLNLASNIAALFTFIMNGNISYKLGVPCVIASVIGNTLGSEFAIKKGEKGIKPVLLIVILLLYIKIVADLFI